MDKKTIGGTVNTEFVQGIRERRQVGDGVGIGVGLHLSAHIVREIGAWCRRSGKGLGRDFRRTKTSGEAEVGEVEEEVVGAGSRVKGGVGA